MYKSKETMHALHKLILPNKKDNCLEKDVHLWKQTLQNFI